MSHKKTALNSIATRLLLQVAIVTIRAMRWLYKWRLIEWEDTDRFLQAAKTLEGFADRFASRSRTSRGR